MIKIVKPGLLSSIQDLGRYGYQKYGVIASGVMDPLAHRIGNLLVGNEENAATIETTLLGPTIEFTETTLISLCGGNLTPTIDGQNVPLWRSVLAKKGSTLKFGQAKNGCRCYIAVAGGWDVPTVMNSKSTYLRAGIGGFNGRSLQSGDELTTGTMSKISRDIYDSLLPELESNPYSEMDWSVTSELIPIHHNNPAIRVIRGREYDLFSTESKEKVFSEAFEITSQSDRMGYRLKGPKLALESAAEMLSEAVNFGTIQVPSEGNPIILLADRQTTGGYPKIGQIATIDLPYVAQLKPGDKLRFQEISHEEAQLLYLKREQQLQQLKQGISLKIN
jgi:antagonist of KipI